MPTVTLCGNVDYQMVNSYIGAVTALSSQPTAEPLRILISSWGGDLGAGISLYNLIRAYRGKTITHNMGEFASVANIVFLAGDRRLASSRSFFRHHGTYWNNNGNQHRVVYEDILQALGQAEQIMTDIFVERANLNADEVRDYFRTPISFDAQTALAKGIIQEVREID